MCLRYVVGLALFPVVQVPIFLALTSALRQMSTGMWPGLSTEGLPFYTDLTSPAVFLETMSTPFGSAGAVLPLAITLAYINIIDRSSGGAEGPALQLTSPIIATLSHSPSNQALSVCACVIPVPLVTHQSHSVCQTCRTCWVHLSAGGANGHHLVRIWLCWLAVTIVCRHVYTRIS